MKGINENRVYLDVKLAIREFNILKATNEPFSLSWAIFFDHAAEQKGAIKILFLKN